VTPGPPPDGEPVPADAALPPSALAGLGQRPFGLYVHVPFCTTRCGYCDFNTYTAAELGPGATRDSYAGQAIDEIRLARRVLGGAAVQAGTVFFGGGTPTLLPPSGLAAILSAIDGEFGLAPGAEVTAEANPETIDQRSLAELRASGFTRMSIGMQSAVSRVLAVLDRKHEPGRPERCVAWARSAGFEHVSLDLIYGTPGETDEDWIASLRSAVSAGPDHISGYALIVEPGTRLAARIGRGELAAPDDDVMADRYLAADELLAAAARPAADSSSSGQPEASRVSSMIRSVRRSAGVRTSRACPGLTPAARRAAYAAGCRTFHHRVPPMWLCAPGPTHHQSPLVQ